MSLCSQSVAEEGRNIFSGLLLVIPRQIAGLHHKEGDEGSRWRDRKRGYGSRKRNTDKWKESLKVYCTVTDIAPQEWLEILLSENSCILSFYLTKNIILLQALLYASSAFRFSQKRKGMTSVPTNKKFCIILQWPENSASSFLTVPYLN